MAYSKQTWDTTSYVNPTRMNHIEDGIYNNSNAIDLINAKLWTVARAEFETSVSGGGDISYSSANIAAKIDVDLSRVVAIIPEGARPKVSWAEVHPVLYFNSSNNSWGIHNFGTGGVAYVDFIVFLKPAA